MDSHNIRRYVDTHGHVRNEGDVQVGVASPYPVSYRSIVPKARECTNLLVPVCLSATHIAMARGCGGGAVLSGYGGRREVAAGIIAVLDLAVFNRAKSGALIVDPSDNLALEVLLDAFDLANRVGRFSGEALVGDGAVDHPSGNVVIGR